MVCVASRRVRSLSLVAPLVGLACKADEDIVDGGVDPVYVRDAVQSDQPLQLDNPTSEAVTWPLWGGAFGPHEAVSVRVTLDASLARNDGLAFGIAGEESVARNVALVHTGDVTAGDTRWQLQLRDGEEIETTLELPVSTAGGEFTTASTYELTFAPRGASVMVRALDGATRDLAIDPPLSPEGESIGTYVRLGADSLLTIGEASLSQASDVDPELDPPLRELAASKGITIGTATDVWPPLHDTDFERLLGEQFDLAAPSEFYWTTTRQAEDAFFMLPADLMVNYARAHDQRIRGYHLVWDLELPPWLLAIAESGDEGAMEAALRDHVWTIVDRYKGRVSEWVVVNEAIWGPEVTGVPTLAEWAESPWADVMGVEYIEIAFQEARLADPDAILLYNETDADTLGAKSDFMLAMVVDFLSRDVPIDGVGLQFHVDASAPPDRDDLVTNMQRFVDAGVDVYITELDVNLVNVAGTEEEKLALQATIYAEVLDACVAVSGCRSYTMWGFTDRYAWYEREGGAEAPLLLDDHYAPKPAFFAVQERLGR